MLCAHAYPSTFKHLADLVFFPHTHIRTSATPVPYVLNFLEVHNDNMATRELVSRERNNLHGRRVMKLFFFFLCFYSIKYVYRIRILQSETQQLVYFVLKTS
jgi:hypothetical protein